MMVVYSSGLQKGCVREVRMGDGVIINMGGKCEFYDTCGFIHAYKGSGEPLKEGWISMFCDDRESSQNCKRVSFIVATGRHPANNMTPTGKHLD